MSARRAVSLAAAALLVIAWCGTALAYRPFDGTDADVAPPREMELELGPVGYERQGSDHFLVAPAVVLNYGLATGIEAVLEGREQWTLRPLRGTGLDDVSLSLKGVLRRGSLQGARGVSVALESGLLLPGSEPRFGGHVASIFSWQWPALSLHLNLTNDFLTSVRYFAGAGLILEGPGRWRVRPVAELLLARDFERHGLTHGLSPSALVGAIAAVRDGIVVDLALRHGAADGRSEDEARLGLTWSFAVH
jgi:hypothetical protein